MGVSGPKFVLSGVRNYVRLLVAAMIILSSSLIGYFYWRDHLHSRLEEVANQYHLKTILYCVQIKEELTRIRVPQTDSRFDIQRSDKQLSSHSDYTNVIYQINKYTQTINQLHRTHGAVSEQARRFEPVIDKMSRQLTSIKAVLEQMGVTSMDPFADSEASLLGSFAHSVEQLRRLHTIARDEINHELNVLNASSGPHLLAIATVAVLLGALVVWKILGGIRRLVEVQKQNESLLRQSATVFESTLEAVVITDVDEGIIAVNKAFTTITGYTEKDVLGKNANIIESERHDQEFYKTIWSSLRQHGEWKGEIWGRRKNGEVFPKWQTISAVRDNDGRVTHYVSVFSDISRIKEVEEELRHLAHHDALTGLPNRLLLHARLEHCLQQARREGTNVAVMLLDLDHFKKINDSLGHAVGDSLLQLVAKRLSASIREADTIARLGGDELTVVLGSLNDARDAEIAAKEILDVLSKPFEVERQDVFVSASIGISVYPQDGRDAKVLLKNADAAMYAAKSGGRNGYHRYTKELTETSSEFLTLETNLYRALEREELLLHFQPQVSLRSGNIVGVEALVRWRHPRIGLVSPAEFVPFAEETGLIGVIGEWVLRSACAQAKAWQDAGLTPFRIAVNLSGRQLGHTNIVREIHDVLEDTGLDPSYLELELTESTVMKNAERAAKTLDALRELGTTIAIDDFGTGYSSMSYLKRFRVDRLKIDRSFVRDIPQDANGVAIAKAIVALGHSLDLSVLAEGVETESQRELLTSIGCAEMQGLLYSAPRPASELVSLLTSPARSACVND